MTKNEKQTVINGLAEQLQQYAGFYLTDISALNAEQTANLRRKCFESDVKLVVVKNTLLTKVIETSENEEMKNLIPVLAGPTAVMYTEAPNAPAKVIKKFIEGGNQKPVLKGAYIQEWPAFVGADKLDVLFGIKSREELIGDIIGLLQSPIRNVLNALENKDKKEENAETAAE